MRLEGLISEFDEKTNHRIHLYICKLARKYASAFPVFEFYDYYHTGYIGYLEACRRADKEKLKATNYAYLYLRISGAIKDFVRNNFGSKRRSGKMKARLLSRDVSLETLMNMVGSIDPSLVYLRNGLRELVWDSLIVRKIEPRYVVAYLRYFFTDCRMSDVAADCGVTESRISQVFKEVNHKHLRRDVIFQEALRAEFQDSGIAVGGSSSVVSL